MAGPAYCPACGSDVDWITVSRAARALGVSERRVRQLVEAGRFPGAHKYDPPYGEPAFWQIPVPSLQAFLESRSTT